MHERCQFETNRRLILFERLLQQPLFGCVNTVELTGEWGLLTRPIQVALDCEADWASLAVHNHGSPISLDFLPLVFNPFAREHASRRPSEGLGLGLYISERIVAAHGGTLSVQSSDAAGTRFTVRLPRRPQ